MITFVFAQLFLACISLSFGTLTIYHYANVAAQIGMLFHNLFPYSRVRYLSGGLLGLAAIVDHLIVNYDTLHPRVPTRDHVHPHLRSSGESASGRAERGREREHQ